MWNTNVALPKLSDLVTFFFEDNGLSYQQTRAIFPPMDIIVDNDEKFIIIKMALSGFKKEDIIIETEDEFLRISGKKSSTKYDNVTYIKNNLKTEDFNRTFAFKDNYYDFRNPQVVLENGELTVTINKNPEFVSPKKQITIE